MEPKIPRAEFLASQIRRKMAEQGITTVYQLGKLSGLQAQSIHNYLEGKARRPDAFSLLKIAKALNTSIDFLVGADEPEVEYLPAGVALAAN